MTSAEHIWGGVAFSVAARHARKSMEEIRAAHAHDDDRTLALGSAKGDGESFAALVDRHTPMVYKFVYRYVADADAASDIVQDAFIKIWKNIGSFDPEKSLTTWMLTIAKNTALDAIKRKKAVHFSAIEEDEDADLDAFLAPYVPSPELPDAIAERREGKAALDRALEALAPAYRSVLLLRYAEHLKFREIASVLEEPIDTIKSRHRRGLVQLRALLERTQNGGLFV